MKLVVQRVDNASVEVDGEIVGEINKGYMVLVGIGCNDTTREADYLASKLLKLRIFEDEDERMNKTIQDVDGQLLLVPQFTLYGDVSHNNRPSFSKAMKPNSAEELFDYYCKKCSENIHVEIGVFGAMMSVSLTNNGPVTLIIEKEYKD
ncbi:D-aminoacyl-tRNA deacylase [Methanosphaera sp.]